MSWRSFRINKGEHRRALQWLYSNNKKYTGKIFILSMVSFVVSVCFILLALISQKVLDIATGTEAGNVFSTGILFIAIIFVQAVLNIYNANLCIRVSTEIEMNIRQTLVCGLLKKQYLQVNRYHSGDILNRLTSDIDVIISGIMGIIPQCTMIITRLCAGLLVLFFVDKRLMLWTCLVGIVTVLGSRLYNRRFQYLHKEVQHTNGIVRSYLQECVENTIVIKSFENEESVFRKLREYQQQNYVIRKKRVAVSNVASTVVYLIFSGGYYVAMVFGACEIMKGRMSVGTVVALLQIIEQIRLPLRNVSGIMPQYYSMIASTERLLELEDIEEEPVENVWSKNDLNILYDWMLEIRIEKVFFSYEDKKEILKEADLRISKGSMVCIAGPSGSGKSTLMKMLLNLIVPQSGRIFIKTKDQETDITAGMRGLFSYVPQGNFILSGTIRENITFGNENSSFCEIEKAAQTACIAEEIENLTDGYETVIGERGIGLSEGQIQRIAIARALLSDSPILLLDECTSALDGETEERLMENLRGMKDRTTLLVTHRETAMKKCDEIYVLKDKIFCEESRL